VWPLAAPIVWIGNLLGTMVTRQTPSAKVTETEVEIIVTEGEQAGTLQHEQGEMIRNVLEFGSVTAGEVMLPRTRVTSFDVSTPIEQVLQVIAETEHSRYPVYRGTIENVFGVLHVKDLLRRVAENDLPSVALADLVRTPVAFVPESQTASSVLKDMRAGRHHMAIVIDEFGGMAGIVTLEDLIEEIVGDIRDEHDEDDPPIVDLGDGRLMVDATISIADLSRYLGTELPENDDYNSLGGFVVSHFGSVPRVGAKLNAFGLDFVVREADDRHVAKVEIVRIPPNSESVLPPSSRSISAA
jgi:CBS domain containing-hemolysin-like protein